MKSFPTLIVISFGIWLSVSDVAQATVCMDGSVQKNYSPCPNQYSVEIQCESRTRNSAGIVDFGHVTLLEKFSFLDNQRELFVSTVGTSNGSPTYLGAGYRSATWTSDSTDYFDGVMTLDLNGIGVSGVPGFVVRDSEDIPVVIKGASSFRFEPSSEVSGSAFGRVGRVFKFSAEGSAQVVVERELVCKQGKTSCAPIGPDVKARTVQIRSEGICIVARKTDPIVESVTGADLSKLLQLN